MPIFVPLICYIFKFAAFEIHSILKEKNRSNKIKCHLMNATSCSRLQPKFYREQKKDKVFHAQKMFILFHCIL